MKENAKTEAGEVETNIKVLAAAQPADLLGVVVMMIQKAQRILAEPDTDGLRSVIAEPVLKAALVNLTEVYEKYRTKRKSKG